MMIVRSKLAAGSRTVIPREIRRRLGLKEGDVIVFRQVGDRVTIAKAGPPAKEDDPFVSFSEWSSLEDAEAYAEL